MCACEGMEVRGEHVYQRHLAVSCLRCAHLVIVLSLAQLWLLLAASSSSRGRVIFDALTCNLTLASSVREAGGACFHGCLFANSLLRTRVRAVVARARKSLRVNDSLIPSCHRCQSYNLCYRCFPVYADAH
jgi:hypothetical protein